MFLSLLLQCKFANSTFLSLLRFSYLITIYDAQASSAFTALIIYTAEMLTNGFQDVDIKTHYYRNYC